MGLALLAIFGTFFGMCVYFRVRARRALAEDMRVLARIVEAAQTTVRDAPEGPIVITGRVTGKDGAVVTATLSGDQVLWARASARSNIGQVIKAWVHAVDALALDDGSGRIANVRLAGATMKLPDESIRDASARCPECGRKRADPSDYTVHFHYESALRAGDTVSVLGTATATGSTYRESAAALPLSADAGELIVFDPDREPGASAQDRRQMGCATLGIGIFGFAMAITAIVMLTR